METAHATLPREREPRRADADRVAPMWGAAGVLTTTRAYLLFRPALPDLRRTGGVRIETPFEQLTGPGSRAQGPRRAVWDHEGVEDASASVKGGVAPAAQRVVGPIGT